MTVTFPMIVAADVPAFLAGAERRTVAAGAPALDEGFASLRALVEQWRSDGHEVTCARHARRANACIGDSGVDDAHAPRIARCLAGLSLRPAAAPR